MKKGSAFSLSGLTILGLSVALMGCQPEAEQPTAQAAPRAVSVDVTKIVAQPVEITSRLPGRTSAYRVAEVRPQVAGIIVKRRFVEGSMVKEGDVLFDIDDATYRVALSSAKASLASAKASLRSAKLLVDRYEKLLSRKAVSQENYDEAKASFDAAQATVDAQEASVQSAQINLGYTKIKAPISGRIGRSYVTEGALVTANQTTTLAKIQQLDPLYLDLSQPSIDFVKLRKSVKGTDEEDKITDIQVYLDDGTPVKQKATLQFAEMSSDETTGTVTLRATLPNPDSLSLPGLFIRADVPTEMRQNGILVPQAAVSRDSRGIAHVFVVGEGNKIEDRSLDATKTYGSNWIVDSGLKADEVVVISGRQKISAGSVVNPQFTEKAEAAKE